MYVCSMSRPEKIAFLRSLAMVASADGQLTPEEEKSISDHSQKLEVALEEVLQGAESMSLEDILEPVEDPIHQRSVLLEMIRLAYCDGEFVPEESQVIKAVAKALDVNEATLDAIHSWVRKDDEHQRLGLDIIENGRE